MPIKPENRSKYPKDWKSISERIRFERAGNRCEVCGVPNYACVNMLTRELCLSDEFNAIRIVLTVAHLDHNPDNCADDNLKAMCQKCHNSYDRAHRDMTIRESRNAGQMAFYFV